MTAPADELDYDEIPMDDIVPALVVEHLPEREPDEDDHARGETVTPRRRSSRNAQESYWRGDE